MVNLLTLIKFLKKKDSKEKMRKKFSIGNSLIRMMKISQKKKINQTSQREEKSLTKRNN